MGKKWGKEKGGKGKEREDKERERERVLYPLSIRLPVFV